MLDVAVYVLVGVNVLLTTLVVLNSRRRSTNPLTEGYLEERLQDLKSGIAGELGRTRAAVELGMRDAEEAYEVARRQLATQIDDAVMRLRDELLAANDLSQRNVQTSVEATFADAQETIDHALSCQATVLRDLKSNYERAIADLRAAVGQASARQQEAIGSLTARMHGDSRPVMVEAVGPSVSAQAIASLEARLDDLAAGVVDVQRSVEATRALLVELVPGPAEDPRRFETA